MGPIISPRVPISGCVARPGILGAAIARARRILKHAPVFFLLLLWISTSALVAQTPANGQFVSQTFWTLNKWYVVVAITAFLVQAFLIVWLLITQTLRRQAEIESRRLAVLAKSEHKRLDEVVSNVPGIVWEARVDPVTHERRTTFISDYVEKMLGYTAEEWMSTPSFALSIVHLEDRERVKL